MRSVHAKTFSTNNYIHGNDGVSDITETESTGHNIFSTRKPCGHRLCGGKYLQPTRPFNVFVKNTRTHWARTVAARRTNITLTRGVPDHGGNNERRHVENKWQLG